MEEKRYRRQVMLLEFDEDKHQEALDYHASLPTRYDNADDPEVGLLEHSVLPYLSLFIGRRWILMFVVLFVM